MNETERAKIKQAINILRQPCDDQHRAARRYYADQLELQDLLGTTSNDEAALWLAELIIEAHQRKERDFSHMIGAPARISDERGEKLAGWFDIAVASSRQFEIGKRQAGLRRELEIASKTQADEIWVELSALDAEYQQIQALLDGADTYERDDQRDAAMRAGKI